MNNNLYKIDIADRTGHTTHADLTLDQAVDTIVNNVENNARWLFIDGKKFEFQGTKVRAEANINKLKTHLTPLVNPTILLTGVLVGGVVISQAFPATFEGVYAGTDIYDADSDILDWLNGGLAANPSLENEDGYCGKGTFKVTVTYIPDEN